MRRTNAVDQGGSCARRDGQLGYSAGEPRLGPQVRAPLLACELQEYGLSREEFSASRSSGAEILEEGNLRRDSEWLYRTNSPGWRLGQRKQKTGPLAAQDKAKTDLEADVEVARSSAEAQAQALRESAAAGKGKISEWWNDLEERWNKAVADIRKKIDSRKAEIDLDEAQANVETAEGDASFAIDYAYAAIEEAEYAVLDAALARKEADELAASSSA